MTPRFFPYAKQVLEILRVHARLPLLAGCSSQSLIVGSQEVEENAGLTLALYALPDAGLKAFHFTQEQVEEANGPGYWRLETGIEPEQTNGWLIFIDPFHLDSETWLKGWNEAYAPLPILGGLASGDSTAESTQVYLNGDVFEEGGVAISFGVFALVFLLSHYVSLGSLSAAIAFPPPTNSSGNSIANHRGHHPTYD